LNEREQATVDYNDLELVAFWVLSSAPSVLLILVGIVAHNRLSKAWMPQYLVLGILGCFIYAMFAGGLVAKLFPPPYDPGLAGGRGLDLRGVGFFIGSWIGALAGVACALVTVAGSALVRRLRESRAKELSTGTSPV
jgi:drug/metabolite transporter (DMT)-like permease